MELGENIKKFRTLSKLTQSDLADMLAVSFQTVSKWESGINEPDIQTIKKMCEIFNCTLDQLINSAPVTEKPEPEDTTKVIKVLLGKCSECGREVYSDESSHQMQRKTTAGIETMLVCEDCYKKHEELNKKKYELEHPSTSTNATKDTTTNKNSFKYKLHSRTDSKVLIWSIIVGAVAFITTLVVCIIYNKVVGIGWTIGLPIIAGYTLLSDVYCIFSYTWISELFLDVSSWSIRFPGIIFSFDLDGLAFLIVMKILFFVLGIMIGIGVFLLALSLASLFSIFCFPFMLARHDKI